MRLVAQRCLYGVDKNPLAVEMAKLSLWLLTLAKDKPFTFLDHAIRCGDSLVGITDLGQLEVFNLACEGDGYPLILDFLKQRIKRAVELRRKLEEMPVKTVEDVQAQESLFAECQALMDRAKVAADWLIAAEFQGGSESDREARRIHAAMQVAGHFDAADFAMFEQAARKGLKGQPTFHWPLEFPEVMVERRGFDALVCNPPFMGGQKITGNLGTAYRDFLVAHLAEETKGSADLCAYFFLRANELLRRDGQFGFLATNTIAQGDTREVGLDRLVAQGCTIPRAVPSRQWPGLANVEVAHVWIRRGVWNGAFVLDEKPTNGITASLVAPGLVTGTPRRLRCNQGRSFQGSVVLGMGFMMEPEEAQRLIDNEPENKAVLFPYLNGEDLNSRPDHSPTRWVINFFDWPLNRDTAPVGYEGPVAEDYPACLEIVELKVKPERMKNNRKARRERWWQFAEKAAGLYQAIQNSQSVMVRARVAERHSIAVVPKGWVYDSQVVVFTDAPFAVLQSTIHETWVRSHASSMRTDLRYTPSDCYETFPFPLSQSPSKLVALGEAYQKHRRLMMLARQEGLTKTYNRFHDPDDDGSDIQHLRALHVEMDKAVAVAYCWTDLDLGHGFHETKQGLRFTISEAARREVLGRLLKLNHERYAEEVAKGLHDKKGKGKGSGSGKGRRASKKRPNEASLFGGDDDEEPSGDASEPENGGQAEARGKHEDSRRTQTAPAQAAGQPPSIDEFDTDAIMAAFRQTARGQGWKRLRWDYRQGEEGRSRQLRHARTDMERPG